jgi:hypothetical protein
MHRRFLIALFVLTASGCYTFQPTNVLELEPGQAVRARITGAFSDSLSTILMRDARTFEGDVVQSDGRSVLLDVPVSSGYRGMRLQTLNQRVEVPRDAFLEVSAKQLSKGRTFAALGAVGVIAGSLIYTQLNSDTGGADRPGGGGPVESVVPVPSFSLPIWLGRLWGH